MIALTFKNNSIKWIIAFGIVLVIYSISYFYIMVPGSDSQYFRGMTEHFIETKNLDPLQPNHQYYQWPSFFILSYIASSVSGLTLGSFEFILYAIIGFLLAVSIYFYASKAYKSGGFLAVPVFFVSMFIFLNYQCVPFSLALGLLFLLIMLETQKKGTSLTVTTLVLFTGVVLTHLFVPMFFIIYLLMRAIVKKSRYYTNLFLFALTLFFVIQFTLAQYSFPTYIRVLVRATSEYSSVVQATITPASIPIDITAQVFSRVLTIALGAISGVGFIFILIKRRLRTLDKAVLLTGLLYSGAGVFLAALGMRAVILAFIPISLGAAWLFESKSRRYFKHIFLALLLILLALFSFVQVHQSFTSAIHFQTQEAYTAANFLIDHSNWEKSGNILAYSSVIPYLESKLGVSAKTFTPYLQNTGEPAIIFYTVGLGKSLEIQNYTMERIFNEKRLNTVYTNGFSYITIKANSDITY